MGAVHPRYPDSTFIVLSFFVLQRFLVVCIGAAVFSHSILHCKEQPTVNGNSQGYLRPFSELKLRSISDTIHPAELIIESD